MMHLRIGWSNSNTIFVQVFLVILSRALVSGEMDLCNQFKTGKATIMVMGETSSKYGAHGDKLLILDLNYNGYFVPFDKFKNGTTGNDTASLDLVGAETFHLDGAKSSRAKGSFLNWFSQMYVVASFSADLKQITLISLEKDKGPQTKRITTRPEVSDIFFSATSMESVLSPKKTNEKELGAYQLRVNKTDGSLLLFLHNGYNGNVPPLKSIDGGFIWNEKVVTGFSNDNKSITVFTGKGDQMVTIVVPFKDFFLCSPYVTNPVTNTKNIILFIGIAVSALVLIVVLALSVSLLRGKKKNIRYEKNFLAMKKSSKMKSSMGEKTGSKTLVSSISKTATQKGSKSSSKTSSQFSNGATSKQPITFGLIAAPSKTTAAKLSSKTRKGVAKFGSKTRTISMAKSKIAAKKKAAQMGSSK